MAFSTNIPMCQLQCTTMLYTATATCKQGQFVLGNRCTLQTLCSLQLLPTSRMLDLKTLPSKRQQLRIAVQDAADVPVGFAPNWIEQLQPSPPMEDWIAAVSPLSVHFGRLWVVVGIYNCAVDCNCHMQASHTDGMHSPTI